MAERRSRSLTFPSARGRRAGAAATLAALALVLAGCSGDGSPAAAGATTLATAAARSSPPATTSAGVASPASGMGAPAPDASGGVEPSPGDGVRSDRDPAVEREDPTCPTAYLAPAPDRPRLRLSYTLAGPTTVTGVERITFTPDRDTDELVLRVWPAEPSMAARGAAMVVTHLSISGRAVPPSYDPADPTLLRVPARFVAGQREVIDTVFAVTLPSHGGTRLGHAGATSWWAGAYPVLAWEPGVGWATEPPAAFETDAMTSPAATVDVSVRVPGPTQVLATGHAAGAPQLLPNGDRRWRFHAEAARDVAVATGPFRIARARLDGAGLAVGLPPSATLPARQVRDEMAAALTALSGRFGPIPYDAVSVAVLPGLRVPGLAFPGVVFLAPIQGDSRRITLTKQAARQWFSGLVGNDQARDPWLADGFATYAEALVDNNAQLYLDALNAPGRIGRPLAKFLDVNDYTVMVGEKAAAALLAAREVAGRGQFDAAVRCYINANAWRIARPSDLSAALADVPTAQITLKDAGALWQTQ